MADENDLIQEDRQNRTDGVSFFGFEIRRKKKDKPLRPSFVPRQRKMAQVLLRPADTLVLI